MYNEKITAIFIVILLLYFCSCGNEENKKVYKEQNISNNDYTSKSSTIDTTSYRSYEERLEYYDSLYNNWDYLHPEVIESDRATTLIKDVTVAEAEIPDFKNMYDAESWLLKNLKTDTSWQCKGTIINYELFFAILNKYPRQTMEYQFDRFLKKYQNDDDNIKITGDRKLKCYAIHTPWTRVSDTDVILYTQYINDSDSICHRLGGR